MELGEAAEESKNRNVLIWFKKYPSTSNKTCILLKIFPL